MGIELAAFLVPCCAIGAVVSLVAWVLLGQRRRARQLAHAWQAFAQQVGGRLTTSGPLNAPRLTWSAGGRDLVLESYRRMGASSDRDPYTRMRLLLRQSAPGFGLRSRRTAEPGLVLQNMASAGATTGNPALDSDFMVTQGDAERLGQAFDADLLVLVRAAQGDQALWLGCAVRHGQLGLEIEARGAVTGSSRLAAWQAALTALATRWEHAHGP